MSGNRTERVATQLRSVLSDLISREVRDPRVASAGLVTVTKVELNRDLSVARVYVSFIGGEEGSEEVAIRVVCAARRRARSV